jgi:UDP-N-acetylmuramoylalanine--D-glutamate ligase
MKLNQLKNKKIALLGLGIENQALLKYLIKEKVKCEITICDARPEINESIAIQSFKNIPIKWKLGKDFNAGLEKFDILFRSPGWPIHCPGIRDALKTKDGIPNFLYSPMKLFFDLCPTKNTIGITGTKGKGTTSSLIYAILKEGGKRAWLGGNIGVALFKFLSKIKKDDWVVLELSSFQLEDLHISPRLAVITNFTSEHLAPADPNNPNYHQSLNDYWKSKSNIFKHQNKNGYLIVNQKMKAKISKAGSKGKLLYFTKSDLPSKLVGEHNKENVAAAEIAASLAGIKKEAVKKAIAKFRGLPHRLEFVREVNKIRYYNDTFATVPEAAITAINSFSAPIILIAGGAEKNSDFKKLAKLIKKKVKLVILLSGEATPRLKKELFKIYYPADRIKDAASMEEAVAIARKNSLPGEIVLLSPACASFGLFKNYKERGKTFKHAVKSL